ncbi:hypothetical protein [Streptomyces sp. C10-9-1]|uniref:hypothetical protein n=1 Tax=Streptomyces sp. C10-9-1 TaxID=1859285 RepID=UPI003F49E334
MFDPGRLIRLPEPSPQPGPRLTYTTELRQDGAHLSVDVDRAAPSDARDRAILRGLLQHALTLIDHADAAAACALPDMPIAAEMTE